MPAQHHRRGGLFSLQPSVCGLPVPKADSGIKSVAAAKGWKIGAKKFPSWPDGIGLPSLKR